MHQSPAAVEVVTAARFAYGALYDARARIEDAPRRFSSGGLVAWSFAHIGLELSDDLLALHGSGERVLGSALYAGDLIFSAGHRNLFHAGHPTRGIGCVGIFTGVGTVVYASPSFGCVLETSTDSFLAIAYASFRGVRRLLAHA